MKYCILCCVFKFECLDWNLDSFRAKDTPSKLTGLLVFRTSPDLELEIKGLGLAYKRNLKADSTVQITKFDWHETAGQVGTFPGFWLAQLTDRRFWLVEPITSLALRPMPNLYSGQILCNYLKRCMQRPPAALVLGWNQSFGGSFSVQILWLSDVKSPAERN